MASLRQEVDEAKDLCNKQTEETTQQIVVEAIEFHNMKEVTRVLKEQNGDVQYA